MRRRRRRSRIGLWRRRRRRRRRTRRLHRARPHPSRRWCEVAPFGVGGGEEKIPHVGQMVDHIGAVEDAFDKTLREG